MKKDVLSEKQGIFIIIVFLIATSTNIITGAGAKNDLWISIILGFLVVLPIAMICARLCDLFPGKDLYDIFLICYGKFFGRLMIFTYIIYCIHTELFIILDYAFFVNIVALPETPKIIPIIVLMLLGNWTIRYKNEILANWSIFFCAFFILYIFLGIFFMIPKMDVGNLFPVFYNGIPPIIKATFGVVSFPFAQIIVFTMYCSGFEKNSSAWRIYIISLTIGSFLILINSVAGLLVSGSDVIGSTYFSSYDAFARINVGNFIQRFEILSAAIYTLGVFMKSSIYLLCITKGIAKLFNFKEYNFVTTLSCLIIVNMSNILHKNVQDNFYWLFNIWPYYSFLFQGILPVFIWISVEIYKKDYAT
ncbi:GerAB/ArcD/ProY family transporter [Tepidibacter hydrothermalis]|uniref:Endospore germination permease n=1 Tax=Tepidibacter hydrothermalis TaxID=3036126 RepID=A0ABY8E843_9FIRM|nr:endospore germination permease [Tepidibacter hydrothermalis]WFD09081.1 endospore germination permease [Tepidibacter hydrothermalis]